MKHKGLLIALIILLLAGGAFVFGMAVSMISGGDLLSGAFSSGKRVGVVTVDGAIISADNAVEDLNSFRENDSVKSVILRIESPGGSVAASQEILEAVRRLAAEKPVLASMGAVAASGGYYIACGADTILANPGTVTGSIGVRMEHVMLGDLLSWAKIKHETLKSGKLKDLGTFDRPMTPEERAVLQGILDDIHVQFKEEVARARKLPMEKVDEIADGRIYTGRQALELGLVDELGGFDEAIKMAGKRGGIKGDPKLLHPKRRHRLIDLLMDSASSAARKLSAAALMDYWQPMLVMSGG
ncbi:MAG TPA: signal peptide peptidase SppA [bacterium]|nr:signal peptide peptidase SppA [bacterium]